MIVSPAIMMFKAISFGVFCRSAPSTSAIIRSRNVSPGFEVILIVIAIGQHPRAAGHRAAVAAGFADHRRALAGDHRFVDGGDALDDLAVAGNPLAGRNDHDVAGPQLRGRHLLDPSGRREPVRKRVGPRLAQRLGLRLAARFGHGLGEGRKQHGEPQPEVDLQLEPDAAPRRSAMSRTRKMRRQDGADLDDEDDGVLHQRDRIQLDERPLSSARPQNLRIEQRPRADELLRNQRRSGSAAGGTAGIGGAGGVNVAAMG